LRVLYGEVDSSSDTFSGSVQLPVENRIVASIPSGIPTFNRL
jgi:hypothetical protein